MAENNTKNKGFDMSKNETTTLTKSKVINNISKLYKKNGYDNKEDWLYIQKRVREKLGLKGFKKSKKLPEFKSWWLSQEHNTYSPLNSRRC